MGVSKPVRSLSARLRASIFLVVPLLWIGAFWLGVRQGAAYGFAFGAHDGAMDLFSSVADVARILETFDSEAERLRHLERQLRVDFLAVYAQSALWSHWGERVVRLASDVDVARYRCETLTVPQLRDALHVDDVTEAAETLDAALLAEVREYYAWVRDRCGSDE